MQACKLFKFDFGKTKTVCEISGKWVRSGVEGGNFELSEHFLMKFKKFRLQRTEIEAQIVFGQ